MSKIMKAIRCGRLEKESLEQSLANYIFAHNFWPNSTTGETPNNLFYRRKLYGPLPDYQTVARKIDDQGIREQDWLKKIWDQQRENEARHARALNIKIGDTVLLKNERSDKPKINPCYDNELYKVIGINGPELTIVSENDEKKKFLRTWSQIKKISREAFEQQKTKPRDQPDEVTESEENNKQVDNNLNIPFDDEEVEEYVPTAPKITTNEENVSPTTVLVKVGDMVWIPKEDAGEFEAQTELAKVIEITSEKQIKVMSEDKQAERVVETEKVRKMLMESSPEIERLMQTSNRKKIDRETEKAKPKKTQQPLRERPTRIRFPVDKLTINEYEVIEKEGIYEYHIITKEK